MLYLLQEQEKEQELRLYFYDSKAVQLKAIESQLATGAYNHLTVTFILDYPL